MPDNFKHIRSFLNFTSSDDYYFLEILRRKKDFPLEEQDKVTDHQTLVTYLVDSLEKFDAIEAEVKAICKLRNARAYFNMDKKSKKKTTMLLMHEILNMVENDDFRKIESKLASAAGKCGGAKDERYFLLDVDSDSLETLTTTLDMIETVKPNVKHFTIPSVNGYHILSEPFDVQKYNDLGGRLLRNVEIKHNSPTILFYEKIM